MSIQRLKHTRASCYTLPAPHGITGAIGWRTGRDTWKHGGFRTS
jgi:hypothetical protein